MSGNRLCAGYLFTYWNSKTVKEREAQIDRVNAQVPSQPGSDTSQEIL